jgi:hypothetical protein
MNNNVKKNKTIGEFISDNKYKIMLGVSVVVIGVLTVSNIRLKTENSFIKNIQTDLKDKLETVLDAITDGGLIDEAIATNQRKLNTAVTTLESFKNVESKDRTILNKINFLEGKVKLCTNRANKYVKVKEIHQNNIE